MKNHFSKEQKKAAPLLIQYASYWSLLQEIEIIKLVEWPVVDNVPALSFVL